MRTITLTDNQAAVVIKAIGGFRGPRQSAIQTVEAGSNTLRYDEDDLNKWRTEVTVATEVLELLS